MEFIILGSLVGILFGCIPLIYGLRNNQQNLALGGFFACVICGGVGGAILTIPMTILFAYLIKKEASRKSNH
jgi:hypothetical protein